MLQLLWLCSEEMVLSFTGGASGVFVSWQLSRDYYAERQPCAQLCSVGEKGGVLHVLAIEAVPYDAESNILWYLGLLHQSRFCVKERGCSARHRPSMALSRANGLNGVPHGASG